MDKIALINAFKLHSSISLVCLAVGVATHLACSNHQAISPVSVHSGSAAAEVVATNAPQPARPEEPAPEPQILEPQLPLHTPINWEEELTTATEHARARRYHEALIHFRLVISAQPHNRAALEGITACAGYVGHHEESIGAAEQLIQLDPSRSSKLGSWIELQQFEMAVRNARAQNDAGRATEAVATMRALSGRMRKCPQYLWWLGYFEAAANEPHASATLKKSLSAKCDGESLDADTVAMVHESLAAIAARAGLWAAAEMHIRTGLGVANVDPQVRAGLEYKLMILKEHKLPSK